MHGHPFLKKTASTWIVQSFEVVCMPQGQIVIMLLYIQQKKLLLAKTESEREGRRKEEKENERAKRYS